MKQNKNEAYFNGKNFDQVLKKLPWSRGDFYLVGVKDNVRKPISMRRASKNLREKFLMGVNKIEKGEEKNMEREAFLKMKMKEENFDKIIIEWVI
jgi:hypothetical protein